MLNYERDHHVHCEGSLNEAYALNPKPQTLKRPLIRPILTVAHMS